MAKTLISSSSPLTTSTFYPSKSSSSPLSSHSLFSLPYRTKLLTTRVNLSFNDIPPVDNSIDFDSIFTKTESLIYTLADAAVNSSPDAATSVPKSGGWFGFISDAMEVVLKELGLRSRFRGV